MLIAALADAEANIDARPRPALERAKSGDLAAFEEIVAAYERIVYRVALRMLSSPEDAQDIAQEVFFKLYRNLRKLEDDQHVRAYLYRVTINACQDALRKRLDWAELAPEFPSAGADPERQTSLEQRKQILASALEGLGVKERAALVLREIEGLSTEQVARILGSTEVTVRSQVSVAQAKLRRIVERLIKGAYERARIRRGAAGAARRGRAAAGIAGGGVGTREAGAPVRASAAVDGSAGRRGGGAGCDLDAAGMEGRVAAAPAARYGSAAGCRGPADTAA